MLDKLEAILDRFSELDRRLAEAGTDFQLIAELYKERSDLEPIVNLARVRSLRTQLHAQESEVLEFGRGIQGHLRVAAASRPAPVTSKAPRAVLNAAIWVLAAVLRACSERPASFG